MVEAVCNSFIWSGGRDSKAKPRVAWSFACLHKSWGGLNLSWLDLWNKAAMLKNHWSFAHKKDRLWIRWINDYYLKHSDVFSYVVPSVTSWMLAKIFDSRHLVENLHDLNACAPHGRFNMKIAYKKLLGQYPKVHWRAIWYNNKATPRSVVCMWQAFLIDFLLLMDCESGGFLGILCVGFVMMLPRLEIICFGTVRIFGR